MTIALTLKASQRAWNVGADLQVKVASLDACGWSRRVERQDDGACLDDVTAATNGYSPGIRNTINALCYDILRATVEVTASDHSPRAV